MIKAIAIDDEPLALDVIGIYCEQLPNITLVNRFTNLNKATKYLNKFDVDLILLDIQMPEINGIDFYNSLKQRVKVIFTTAHAKYAVEGFKINASDYLLKPIELERFAVAINRVEKEIELESNHVPENTHLNIRADYKLHHIDLKTILYIEGMDDYIKIHILNHKTIVARSTMKSIVEKLPEPEFVRVHKSYIVPLKKIKSISTHTVKIEGHTLPLGNAYKKNLDLHFK